MKKISGWTALQKLHKHLKVPIEIPELKEDFVRLEMHKFSYSPFLKVRMHLDKEQHCTFKKMLFFLRPYQGKFHQYSKNEQSTSTIYFNKRRLSWKEYKWWELALNWFIPCSNKRNVSSLSCLICKYAEHPASDSTSLIKPCTKQSSRYFILMKIHDDDFRLYNFRVGTMYFPVMETRKSTVPA